MFWFTEQVGTGRPSPAKTPSHLRHPHKSSWHAGRAVGSKREMADAKDGAPRMVASALDFPAVGQHDLLHDGEAQPSALLLGRKIRLEDLAPVFRRDPGAVVAKFEDGFGGI